MPITWLRSKERASKEIEGLLKHQEAQKLALGSCSVSLDSPSFSETETLQRTPSQKWVEAELWGYLYIPSFYS